MINLGNNQISNIMLGETQVQKVYLGTNLVWEHTESGGDDSRLPNGYTELDYIASTKTGGQYIDLNILLYDTLNKNYDIAMKFNAIGNGYNTSQQGTIFGCQDNTDSPWPGTFIRMSNNNMVGRYIGGTGKDNTLGQLGNDIELTEKTPPAKNVTNYNNSNKTHTWGTSLFCIFNNQEKTAFDRFIEAKLYYFKLFVEGTLVRDMIPCINPSNVVGLYDLVNNVFYSSPNGVAFEAGNVVAQTLLDSVCSSNDIIDFGIIPNENTVIEVLYKTTTSHTSNDVALFNHYHYTYSDTGYTVTLDSDSTVQHSPKTNPQLIRFSGDSVCINEFATLTNSQSYTANTNLTTANANIVYYHIKITNGNTVMNLRPIKNGNSYGFIDTNTNNIYVSDSWSGGNVAPYTSCVEYLATTENNVTSANTPFINSEIIPSNTTGMMTITQIDYTGNIDTYLYGTRENTSNSRYIIGHSNGDGWYIGFNGYNVTTRQSFGKNRTKTMVSNNYMNDRSSEITNFCNGGNNRGWLTSTYTSTTLVTQTHPIWVDANSGVQSTTYFAHKTYMFAISDNQQVLRYFVPVRVDNEGCYYDIVNGQLYHNVGGNSYTYGTDC